MDGGHASSHAQHQLVPTQVKELGYWEDAGHKVSILTLSPEFQTPLLAVDFQGNLWVPICICHLEQIPRVLIGVFLQQQCQHQSKLFR